jgi:hypothetical protein
MKLACGAGESHPHFVRLAGSPAPPPPRPGDLAHQDLGRAKTPRSPASAKPQVVHAHHPGEMDGRSASCGCHRADCFHRVVSGHATVGAMRRLVDSNSLQPTTSAFRLALMRLERSDIRFIHKMSNDLFQPPCRIDATRWLRRRRILRLNQLGEVRNLSFRAQPKCDPIQRERQRSGVPPLPLPPKLDLTLGPRPHHLKERQQLRRCGSMKVSGCDRCIAKLINRII